MFIEIYLPGAINLENKIKEQIFQGSHFVSNVLSATLQSVKAHTGGKTQ